MYVESKMQLKMTKEESYTIYNFLLHLRNDIFKNKDANTVTLEDICKVYEECGLLENVEVSLNKASIDFKEGYNLGYEKGKNEAFINRYFK